MLPPLFHSVLLSVLVVCCGVVLAETKSTLRSCSLEISTDPQTGTLNMTGKGEMIGCVGVTQGMTTIRHVIIGEGITSIEGNVFQGCVNLLTVSMPSTLKSIGLYAFANCSSLRNMNIPSGVESIEEHTFNDCNSLVSVDIPATVKSIKQFAFANCTNLRTVNISSGSSLTSIEQFAFDNCLNLSSITIPSTVNSIGQFAFRYCTSLTSVRIPHDIESIEMFTFCNCSSLVSVDIPQTVKSIGQYAFRDCTSLKNISLPSSITSIEEGTFLRCRSLTEVAIPTNITSIGKYAFQYCENLKSVSIPSSVTSIGIHAFAKCISLVSVTLPPGLTIIEDYLFSNCSNLTHVTIPSSVTTIETYAFENCNSLTTVTIPSNVSMIGAGSFHNCDNLTSVTILSESTTIDYHAFVGCKNLENVTIVSNVTSIGNLSFNGCPKLKSFNYYGTSIPDCEPDVFSSEHGDNVCVTVDYKSTMICNRIIRSEDEHPQYNLNDRNQCAEVFLCGNGKPTVKERWNTTLWKNRTTGCIEYECDNETGPVKHNICNSSEGIDRLCIDDKCVVDSPDDEEWKVEIEFNQTMEAFDAEEFKQVIITITQLDADEMRIGIEHDDYGQIERIIIFVKDEDKAKVIADSIESRVDDCGDETSPICQVREIHVSRVKTESLVLSAIDGRRLYFETVLTVLLALMMLFD